MLRILSGTGRQGALAAPERICSKNESLSALLQCRVSSRSLAKFEQTPAPVPYAKALPAPDAFWSTKCEPPPAPVPYEQALPRRPSASDLPRPCRTRKPCPAPPVILPTCMRRANLAWRLSHPKENPKQKERRAHTVDQLFFWLRAPHTRGHEFVSTTIDRGCGPLSCLAKYLACCGHQQIRLPRARAREVARTWPTRRRRARARLSRTGRAREVARTWQTYEMVRGTVTVH